MSVLYGSLELMTRFFYREDGSKSINSNSLVNSLVHICHLINFLSVCIYTHVHMYVLVYSLHNTIQHFIFKA